MSQCDCSFMGWGLKTKGQIFSKMFRQDVQKCCATFLIQDYKIEVQPMLATFFTCITRANDMSPVSPASEKL